MENNNVSPNQGVQPKTFVEASAQDANELSAFMQLVYADTYPNEKRGTTREMFEDTAFLEHVEDYLTNQLKTEGRRLWFTRDDQDRIVGTIGLQATEDPKDPEIWGFYVLPESQGAGVGGELWDNVIDAAHESGATKVHLNVALDSTKARPFYESRGMRPVGEPHAVQWPQWKQEYRDANLINEYQRMEMDLL